jgi:hypothetical protein
MYSAFTEAGKKAWLHHIAATQKCNAGAETSSLGKKSQVI